MTEARLMVSLEQHISGLTLTVRPTRSHFWMMEALPTVTPTAYIRSSPWRLRLIRSHFWMMEALLMVAQTTYIGSYP